VSSRILVHESLQFSQEDGISEPDCSLEVEFASLKDRVMVSSYVDSYVATPCCAYTHLKYRYCSRMLLDVVSIQVTWKSTKAFKSKT
jgi:hypothetical protein